VHGVIRVVANARPGERNNATFWAACRAGEMVRQGWITQDAATGILLDAAVSVGLPRVAALKTIKSGLRTGGSS
jgi:hypothetical protein